MKNLILPIFLGIALVAFVIWEESAGQNPFGTPDPVAPNWASITAWPRLEATVVEATPNPNRRITAIVLDDSGSMQGQMEPAKSAVLGALEAMSDTDRVAVIALNAGVVLDFTEVAKARRTLPRALAPIRDTRTTPLTRAMVEARRLLEQEGSAARGFGTYRMIITTDGAADRPEDLTAEVEGLAAHTPIQLTTIGIGISGRHVLRRADLGSFVDVSNVAALQGALEAAVAENTNFTSITNFEGGN